METRRLRNDDHPWLRELLESTGVFAAEEVETALEVADDVLHARDDYQALVAVDESDRPVAFAIYGPAPMTESTWDLYWIATHQRMHGKGIGRRLLTRVEEDVRSQRGRMIRIETSGKDAYGATRVFYEKTNYRPVGCFPNFYRAGDDLVILAKDLGPLELRPGVRLPS